MIVRRVLSTVPLAVATAAASRPMQSALEPFGDGADAIATLWWIMLAGAIVIFTGVITLVLLPLWRPRAAAPSTDDPRANPDLPVERTSRLLIVGGGLVFPGVVLTLLLGYTVVVGARLAQSPADALSIEVTGHMWWWEVRYGSAASPVLVSANELRIPAGRAVEVKLKSGDVIHSFWIPNLAGKTDMIPGRTNRLTLHAREPGTYRAQCAEFCGLQHAQMALYVVAEEAETFDAWLARMRLANLRRDGQADDSLLTDTQRHGRSVFVEAGCGACHSLRGVSDAPPGLGPDLTGVGGRRSLAAGLLPNNPGTLGAWIVGAQQLKPGSRMPSFHTIAGADLTALVDYLGSLR